MGSKGSNLYRLVAFLLFSIPFFLSSSVQVKSETEVQKLEENILQQGWVALSNSKLQLNEVLNEELQKYRKASEIIAMINQRHAQGEDEVLQLQQEVSKLRIQKEEAIKQYRSILLTEYKHRDYEQKLFYLASSENLKDLFTRSKHLKKLKKLRKQQLESIENQEAIISDKLLIYNGKDDDIDRLLEEKLEEVSRATNKIKSVKQQLLTLDQEANNLKLNLQELKGSSRQAKRTSHADFVWPVSQGLVTTKFGKHHHNLEHGVMIESKGIDILCHASENVRAISMGVVKSITHLPKYGKTMIVAHNEYLAVYAGLEDIEVNIGDFVYPSATLGSIHQNAKGQHLLHFELWLDNMAIDPFDHFKASL